MKTYEGYIAELEALKQLLKGSIFYIALPACFFADAKANDADAYFYMIKPKGKKRITLQKWNEVAGKPDTETYAMPGLSPKMERLYFENMACYLSKRKWKTITSAAKNFTSVKLNKDDARLLNYMASLPKNEQQELIKIVDFRRKNSTELKQKVTVAVTKAEQDAKTAVNSRQKLDSSTSTDSLRTSEETLEERMKRISQQIAVDFDEDFEPFW